MRDLYMKNPADLAGSAGELGWISLSMVLLKSLYPKTGFQSIVSAFKLKTIPCK